MLLERADALSALHAALERVRGAGTGELVSVAGEAGIGKTSLLHEFTRSVPETTWWGGCDPLHSPRPLGPLLDVAHLAGGELDELLRAGAPRPDVFDASLRAIVDRAAPVVLVIEDAHWADEATLDWLTFLGRRIDGVAALVLISHRDDDTEEQRRLRAVLGTLGLRSEQRVSLAPLSLASVRAMVGPRPVDAEQLQRITGGNPFYVTECLGAMVHVPGPAVEPRARLQRVPDSVADAVSARVARLPDDAARCLAACSVHPDHLTLDLIGELAGGDAIAVDVCVAHGLLLEVPGALAFRHELARQAVLDTVPPARRRRLHRRALRSLIEAETSDPAWLAYHAEEAADPADILRYAPAAAARARAVGANRVATSHLAAAVRHAHQLPAGERAVLEQRYAAASFETGALGESLAAYQRAAVLWHELGDPVGEANARAEMSGPLVHGGRQPEAVASVRAALALLEPLGASPELALVHARMCAMHMLAREFVAAADSAARSQEMCLAVGRDDHLSKVLIDGGVARLMNGVEAGIDDLRRGIAIARELDLPQTVQLGYSQLGSGAGEIRRYDLAVPALREAIAWGTDHQLSVEYPQAWLARCELDLGNWAEAERLATGVVSDPSHSDIARFVAATVLGRLRARRGDPDVWPPLDEAKAIALRTGHLQRLWPVAAARAEAAWLGGRLADEVDLLAAAYSQADATGYPWAIGELGFWLYRAGRLDILQVASARPFRLLAAGASDAAADAWSALGCPYEAALARSVSDRASTVREAFVQFDRLGAQALLPPIADRLRAMGSAVPARRSAATRADPDGLTNRQAEIAELLRRGLTNKEIATKLYLSEKTVEHHVSAVLNKLGLSSRRAMLNK
jgi:DNA-binding CsgD family transcriptional regulator/tetratricopeptide (TPR) repeat protein